MASFTPVGRLPRPFAESTGPLPALYERCPPDINSISRPPISPGNLFHILKVLLLFQFNTRFYFPLGPKMLHRFATHW